MAVITPDSDVILLKVPLEIDDTNQLTFATASDQYAYFSGLTGKKSYEKFTYQRKDGVIRIPEKMDDIINYNYVMYRNNGSPNKWFYAYITGMEYVNEEVTAVSIKTDCFQTWQFNLTYKRCFVEREHTNSDVRGNNTLPENVELGEYVKNSNVATPEIGPTVMFYAIGVSEIVGELTKDGNPVTPTANINGLPNGLYYIFADTIGKFQTISHIYDHAGKASAIYTMFVFPKEILNVVQGQSSSYAYTSGVSWDYSDATYTASVSGLYIPTSNDLVGTISKANTVSIPTTVGMTYTPRNKKLLTYPYCFFNIANNCGTTVTYKYEDFSTTPSFDLVGVFDVGCTTKLYPTNYKNMTLSTDNPYEYGITGGKYPTISWNSDSYTNWLTQNAVNIGLGMLGAAAGTIGGLATGHVGVAAASLYTGVTGAVSQIYKASLMPDQAKGNTNAGDLNYSAHKNKFTVYQLSIKPEYAAIIDEYFDMFGYKTNRVKIPNVTGRPNWNYVKTIGCYIQADIPQEDLQTIKNMFNNGVTFWHNASTFGDYSQSNTIVTP